MEQPLKSLYSRLWKELNSAFRAESSHLHLTEIVLIDLDILLAKFAAILFESFRQDKQICWVKSKINGLPPFLNQYISMVFLQSMMEQASVTAFVPFFLRV